MGTLRFPDAVQERQFVQHAGEHGLSVMRFVLLLIFTPGHKHRAWPKNSLHQAANRLKGCWRAPLSEHARYAA